MAYTFDNRVKFIVRYMYDIDNNGFLDVNDFECLAVKTTLIEGRGEYSKQSFDNNKKIMINLWNEIAELADFNKDGQVTVDEFKQAIKKFCTGKKYEEFPPAFRTFIGNTFKTIDVNGDGIIGLDEYRLDCVMRSAFTNIEDIDNAFAKLISEDDKKVGGICIKRYQDLYAQFISNPDEKDPSVYLFGPLQVL